MDGCCSASCARVGPLRRQRRSGFFGDQSQVEVCDQFSTIAVTLGSARRVKNEVGVDFGSLGDGRLFLDLSTDPFKLGAVLWVLLESQAVRQGLTPETFFDEFDGDALEGAVGALGAALVNFTPGPMRAAVAKVIAKSKEAQAAAMETVEAWVETQPVAEAARTAAARALSTYGGGSPS